MKSILIVGGSGTFGRAFIPVALDAGVERIRIFSRGEHRQAEMREKWGDDARVGWLIGDVRDKDRLTRAMQGCDVVIHAAAIKRIETCEYDVVEMVKTNVSGAVNVVEAATDAGVEKVVALSTDKACEPGVNAYGVGKALAERIFLSANNSRGAHGPIFACVRYGNIFASQGSVVPRWQTLIARGHGEVPATDPRATRFFMTPKQACDLVIQTIRKMKGGELVIPDLPAYRLGDLAEAMEVDMRIIGMPEWEKKHESMKPGETSEDARRMSVKELKAALEHVA